MYMSGPAARPAAPVTVEWSLTDFFLNFELAKLASQQQSHPRPAAS